MQTVVGVHILALLGEADGNAQLARFLHLALNWFFHPRPDARFTRRQRQPPAYIVIGGNEVVAPVEEFRCACAQLDIARPMPFPKRNGLVNQLERGLAVGSNHRADVRKWERDDPSAGEWAGQGAHWQIASHPAIAPTYLQPRYGVTVD